MPEGLGLGLGRPTAEGDAVDRAAGSGGGCSWLLGRSERKSDKDKALGTCDHISPAVLY
jgi:hypothetical protein